MAICIFFQFQMGNDGGVYGEDENRFIFNNVIVGRRAKARFKISNTNKVPCDVVFSIKPVVIKGQAKHQDIFEVEPVRAEIANHSHVYATVTFVPPSMQVKIRPFLYSLILLSQLKMLLYQYF